MRTAEWPELLVDIVFLVRSEEFFSLIERNVSSLCAPGRGTGIVEDVYIFTPSLMKNVPDFAERVLEILYVERKRPVLFVSDVFLEVAPGEPKRATELAHIVHAACFANKRVCNLVALCEDSQLPVQPVGSVVDLSGRDLHLLREKILVAATRLSLHSVTHRVSHESEVAGVKALKKQAEFIVQPVSSEEQLSKVFRLRHQVYSLLGYLKADVAGDPSLLDIDSYDRSSIQFQVIHRSTLELAGTLRLVLPHRLGGSSSLFGASVRDIVRSQTEWMERARTRIEGKNYRSRLDHVGPTLLPMLGNVRVNERWKHLLTETQFGAEASRLIVHPRYRGDGISRLLLYAAIATSVNLRRRVLFGESSPLHLEMYRKYGFEDLENRYPQPDSTENFCWSPQGMLINLAKGDSLPHFRIARYTGELLKLANPHVEDFSGLIGAFSSRAEPQSTAVIHSKGNSL